MSLLLAETHWVSVSVWVWVAQVFQQKHFNCHSELYGAYTVLLGISRLSVGEQQLFIGNRGLKFNETSICKSCNDSCVCTT
jgi:hypothetical protein